MGSPGASPDEETVFHVKHEGLTAAARELGIEVPPAQEAQLLAFEELLLEKAAALGMIAKGDLGRLRERHLLDCLRAGLAVGEDDRNAADLGSGAGLPGIVVAIVRPALTVTLAETRQQRIAFLELVVSRLGLANVRVHGDRAERLPAGEADLCFARAFKDVTTSWGIALPLLAPGGRLVYFAGEGFRPDRDLPPEVSWSTLPTSSLARSGPLVIMTRQ
jgi:16S rRNA (guanine527-N7)-methyltransferase